METQKSNVLLIVILVVVALALIAGAYVFGYSNGVRVASTPDFSNIAPPVSENPFAVRNPFEYQNPFK